MRRTREERFLQKFDQPAEGCWEWKASLDGRGYGQFSYNPGHNVRSHRFSYELFVGPIPEGLTIDHLCRNPKCVRPNHLEPVTMAENNLRARGWHTGFCKRGHELTPANIMKAGAGRTCRRCHYARTAEWYGREANW